VEYGIEDSDPFGVGALFLSRSMAHRFDCSDDVEQLLGALLDLPIPVMPDLDIDDVVTPIDALLARLEEAPALVELVGELLRLGAHTPPRTEVSEQLYRSVMWTMMRYDPGSVTHAVLDILRTATPGARYHASDWPRHEFFSTVLVLVYLGGPTARTELNELLAAARDLAYHDLAPVLEWYLDHHHVIPPR